MRKIALAAGSFLLLGASLSAADPALLNLVMPDAKVLAGINVQKAKTSAFGQFVLHSMPSDSDFHSFIASTGFDPRSDLTEVLVASSAASNPAGTAADNTEHKNGLILAKGTFNPALIAAQAEKDGKHVIQTYNGASLITSTNTADSGALAFLQNNIAIAGDLANVKGAIDRRAQNNAIDPGLAAKVSGYAAADAWSVSIAPLSAFSHGAQAGPMAGALNGDLLKTVQQSSGSIVFGTPVQITAEAVAKTDKDAISLGDVVKFFATMIQTNGDPNTAAIATLAQSLKVSTDRNTLTIGLTIPEDQLESLITAAHSQKAGRAKI